MARVSILKRNLPIFACLEKILKVVTISPLKNYRGYRILSRIVRHVYVVTKYDDSNDAKMDKNSIQARGATILKFNFAVYDKSECEREYKVYSRNDATPGENKVGDRALPGSSFCR